MSALRPVRPALAAVLLSLLLPAASAAVGLVTEISNAASNEAHTMKQFDTVSVGIGDFDGDGWPEFVAYDDNEYVYVMSTKDSTIRAEFKPPGDGAPPNTSPMVADVDGDGALDIVVVSHPATTCRYEYDAAASTSTSFSFVEKWCRRATAYDGSSANADGAPWVEDVDGDGRMETFMQTEQVGYFAYDAGGNVRWSRGLSGGNAGPVVGDLDGDGDEEVVFFGDAGEVRALDAKAGVTKWSKNYQSIAWPGSIVVGGTIGDLENDGKKEIAFVLRDASHTDDLDANHFALVVLRADGVLKWKAQPSWGNPMSYSHPVFVDVTGDGIKEILSQDWNTMGHKPGDWEPLGPANVFAYRADGALLWRTELSNDWSNDDLVVGDLDGDGRLEVGAIGRSSGTAGFWLLDARTGAKETHVAASGWNPHRGPWATRLPDGDLGFILGVHTSTKGGGFRVYDANVPCALVFGAWGLRDPCDPPGGAGTPPPPPPPPSGNFTAAFDDVGGNEWWIETDVTADRTLAGVDVRLDGGAWKPLSLRSWGAWAASYHAPEGTLVQFRARSVDGDEALSGCHRWVLATPVDCDGAPPPPGFAATFEDVRGNEWWVETEVDADEPLAGVDARVDGGAWVALDEKSWGSWAKSIHAPPGSEVQFRARSADGDIALSSTYTWPP